MIAVFSQAVNPPWEKKKSINLWYAYYMHLILSNPGLRPNSRLTEALCEFLSTSLRGLIGRSEILVYNYILGDVLATRMSRHHQTLPGNDSPRGENKRSSVEPVSATGKKAGRTWIEWWFRSLLKWGKETVGVAPNAHIPFQCQKERRSERKGKKKANEQRILTPLEDTGPRCTADSRAWCTSPPRPPSRSWQCASPHKRTSFCDGNTKSTWQVGNVKWKWAAATGRRRWHKHGSAAASWVNALLLVSTQ